MRRPIVLILRSRNRQRKAVRCITLVSMGLPARLGPAIPPGKQAIFHSRYSLL